ncbi:MAG: esterase family protein [Bacteroidales bacterium]|jgi:S-formylglutathione hydrolase FrmB|nr:esterase family protein [Bacteroidales bacterium]
MKKIFFSLILMLFFFINSYSFVIDTIAVPSRANGISVNVLVILPQDSNIQKFPVVYLLHGYTGNETDWLTKKKELPEVADKKRIIIVCPDGKNSWYLDSPLKKDNQYETFISQELVEYIDKHYPTIPDRRQRAITGLSMGGHGALYNAFRHPDVFGAAGSMSGAIDTKRQNANFGLALLLKTMTAEKKDWGEHSVIYQLKNLKNNQLAIIVDCGINDFCFPLNETLHKTLVEKGIDHDYTVRPGEHTWEYWSNSLDYHILFFCKYFSSF